MGVRDSRQPIDITGATVRSRTADILITSEVLYQLSYGGPKCSRNIVVFSLAVHDFVVPNASGIVSSCDDHP